MEDMITGSMDDAGIRDATADLLGLHVSRARESKVITRKPLRGVHASGLNGSLRPAETNNFLATSSWNPGQNSLEHGSTLSAHTRNGPTVKRNR